MQLQTHLGWFRLPPVLELRLRIHIDILQDADPVYLVTMTTAVKNKQ
jgi:hypothetical protein